MRQASLIHNMPPFPLERWICPRSPTAQKKKKKVCAPVVQILFYLSTVQLLQAGPRDLCTKLSGPRKADLLENTLLYAVVDSLWTPLGACQILWMYQLCLYKLSLFSCCIPRDRFHFTSLFFFSLNFGYKFFLKFLKVLLASNFRRFLLFVVIIVVVIIILRGVHSSVDDYVSLIVMY